jgi:hypothetical protein
MARAVARKRVPFLDLAAAYEELRSSLDAAVERVLSSGRCLFGPELTAFEQSFASYVGTRHCVAVGSGFERWRPRREVTTSYSPCRLRPSHVPDPPAQPGQLQHPWGKLAQFGVEPTVVRVHRCGLVLAHRPQGQHLEPGTEVVTFSGSEDCIDKAKWLLDHPRERRTITQAGQLRTLAAHTFAQRAEEFDAVIRDVLGSAAARQPG